jgi:hypothetical protein
MRYSNNRTKKTIDGKEVYTPKMYPTIPESFLDIHVATETGDRLDTLAFQFYNDASLWWIIASANHIHTAPIGFADGTILRIPTNHIEILQQTINR